MNKIAVVAAIIFVTPLALGLFLMWVDITWSLFKYICNGFRWRKE